MIKYHNYSVAYKLQIIMTFLCFHKKISHKHGRLKPGHHVFEKSQKETELSLVNEFRESIWGLVFQCNTGWFLG